jgi:glycosyltransferase involved in cell wall biosynthesis
LKQRRHIQLIVCPQDSPLAKRAAGEGQEVMPLGSSGKLRSHIRDEKFDIVHAHDAKAQTISFRASLGLPVRRVASRQVAFRPRHPLIHRWKYSRTCDGVIANSQSVRQVLLAAGVPDSHIEVISPGVEIPKELPNPKARAEARARMLLVGDGPERIQLAREESGIVHLPGFIASLDEFYAALDLYIMPSRSEGWGLTALRAMAFGIPVVASNVGGLPEVVESGKTGWLVPSESPEALAEAILNAASDPDRLCEYGRNARQRASQFSIERTVEQTEQLYRRLLAAPPSTRPAT